MAKYLVTTSYEDGTKRMLETGDGGMAMREAANACYQEDKGKAVSLEKDGTSLFSEKIKPYGKPDMVAKG